MKRRAVAYWWVIDDVVVFTGGEPSPKSHRYVSVSPGSGSLLPEPSRVTGSPMLT